MEMIEFWKENENIFFIIVSDLWIFNAISVAA